MYIYPIIVYKKSQKKPQKKQKKDITLDDVLNIYNGEHYNVL